MPSKNEKLLQEIKDKHGIVDPATGCWNWQRGIISSGYGHFWFEGQHVLIHRLAAHLENGFDLESPLCVLHRCDNRQCFNPAHLFIGTKGDNIRDCVKKGRYVSYRANLQQCPRGHPYSGDNLYKLPRINGRACKICRRQHLRKWRERKRAAA